MLVDLITDKEKTENNNTDAFEQTSAFVQAIIEDIGHDLSEIMVDRYGNYFC